MTKEELIQFLKDNLRIETNMGMIYQMTQQFSGKRIKRGLYRSSDGRLVNADINGSVNILRKYFKERKWNWVFQDHVRAFVNRPCQRVNPLCSSSIL